MKKTIVLCSGGLDSSTLLYMQRKTFDDSDILVLFFNYSQKNYEKERTAVHSIVPQTIELLEIDITDAFKFSQSSLVNPDIQPCLVKQQSGYTHIIPYKTNVEYRNGVFIAIATSIAQQRYFDDNVDIVLGTYGNNDEYFDCTEIFYKAVNAIAERQTASRHHVLAPLSVYSKAEVYAIAKKLKLDVDSTWSCFLGGENPCGVCAACTDIISIKS